MGSVELDEVELDRSSVTRSSAERSLEAFISLCLFLACNWMVRVKDRNCSRRRARSLLNSSASSAELF